VVGHQSTTVSQAQLSRPPRRAVRDCDACPCRVSLFLDAPSQLPASRNRGGLCRLQHLRFSRVPCMTIDESTTPALMSGTHMPARLLAACIICAEATARSAPPAMILSMDGAWNAFIPITTPAKTKISSDIRFSPKTPVLPVRNRLQSSPTKCKEEGFRYKIWRPSCSLTEVIARFVYEKKLCKKQERQ